RGSNLPKQFVIVPPFLVRLALDDSLMFAGGDAAFRCLLNGRPELRRNDRGQEPAHSERQVMQAAEIMVGKGSAGAKNGLEILRRGLEEFPVSDRVEDLAFDGAIAAHTGALATVQTIFLHHEAPSPLGKSR